MLSYGTTIWKAMGNWDRREAAELSNPGILLLEKF